MKVKICGFTHPEDVKMALDLGVDFIGLNFSKFSKRRVTLQVAEKLVNDKTVGIFVEQDEEEIRSICSTLGINHVQIYSRFAMEGFKVFYGIQPLETCPKEGIPLIDVSHGSGKKYELFEPPVCEWFLAGGLNPQNVKEAISFLQPTGVDVATGVEYQGSTRKDSKLIQAFIKEAK